MKKTLKTASMFLALCSISMTAGAAEPDVYLENNKLIGLDAFIDENGRTQVGVRGISEHLGFYVDWDEITQTVSITDGTTYISMKIGDNILIKDGETTVMDTAAQIINDKTYIPLRYFSEAVGYEIAYDAEQSAMYINYGDHITTSGVFDPSINTNPRGLFMQDFNPVDPTPLSDEWYEGEDIPEEIKNRLNLPAAYTAKDVTKIDDESIKDGILDLSQGNYIQNFWMDDSISVGFFTEVLLKPSTDKIFVMIESDDIAADDLWVNLEILKIADSGENGMQAFFKEAWHKTFDKKAVVVFDDLDKGELYSVRISSVALESFEGNVVIGEY